MSVTEYKVKLFDIIRNAKITDSIFKRHIFTAGLNENIRAKLALMDNRSYRNLIRNAKKCQAALDLE